MRVAILICSSFLFLTVLAASAAGQASAGAQDQISNQRSAPVTEYTLPPDKLEKSRALYLTDNWLGIISTLYSFIVLVQFLRWRLVGKFRDWAERVSRVRFVQSFVVVPLFVAAFFVFMLPPDIYGHHIGRLYGLSVQGWGSWFRDWAVGLALVAVLGAFVSWILYAIIRRSQQRWWFWFWLAVVPISAFLTFISPAVIEPMFNKYEALQPKHPELVAQLERVIERTGVQIPPQRMYLMIASAKVTGPNAYVTGFGATKRVVVWDTSIKELTIPQLMFVFGHELGHYVLGHVWKGFVFGLAVFFVLFYLGFRLARWMERRWGGGWGIRDLGDWASLPMFVLIISILVFLSSPGLNAYSRYLEHQADQFGLEVVHGLVPDSSQVAAQSFQILGEQWLDYPYPSRFAVFWNWNHPPINERVRYALEYDPWGKGKAPEFVDTAGR